MKKQDKLIDVIHRTAKGLHKAGVMDAETMREFDVLCLKPKGEISIFTDEAHNDHSAPSTIPNPPSPHTKHHAT